MTSEPSKLNGIIVSTTLSWMRRAYGDDVVERALLQLPSEQRASLKKLVISLGWYDISLYERLLDLCYEEVKKKTGETRESFDQRGIEEVGGGILNTVYRFIFSLMQPSSILNRISALFKRNYSHGSVSVVENQPGYCLLLFELPNDMRSFIMRHNEIGYPHVLKMAGAKNITTSSTHLETKSGCQIRLELRYQ